MLVPDRKQFFEGVRIHLCGGTIGQSQVDGINSILNAWDKVTPAPPLSFAAYSLGTTFRETARTMQPIAEYGQGRGRLYGVPTGPWHQVYFGRGEVQLTWEENYRHATQRLRALGVLTAAEDLEKTPILAMRPDVAAAIMIHGMMEGWFTGKKLGDYFNDRVADWVNARSIINDHDVAALVASYALVFYHAMTPVLAAAA